MIAEKKKILIINYPLKDKNDLFRLINIKIILEIEGFDITIIKNNIWGDYSKKVEILKNPFLLVMSIPKYLKYLNHIKKNLTKNKYYKIIIGHPAFIEALFLRSFLIKNKIIDSVIIDFFISLYDTIILDRNIFKKNIILKYIFFQIDKTLLNKYKYIMVDTNANALRYSNIFHIELIKFKRVIVSSALLNSNYEFYENISLNNKIINIGWVGSFIPLHGLEKIIYAAKLIDKKKYLFHIIGNGPKNELIKYYKQVKELGVDHLKFYGELPFIESMKILSKCDILLGVFGDSEKAKTVIPFKIFDYLILKKPIITQYSEAIKELDFSENIIQVENNSYNISKAILNIDFNNKEEVNYSITIKNQFISDLNKVLSI